MKSTYTIVLSLLIMCGVFGADEDEVKSVSVMEGDSVTLNPDLTQIQGMVLLLWWFGEKGFTIAQIDGKDIVYEDYEVFRGRLQLIQTGSLTITNVRTNHSGLYKAEISHKSGTLYIKFRVTVYESPSVITGAEAEMKSMSVKEGDPVTLHVPQIQGDELIVWRFGDEGKLIAKHDLETKSSPLYYETDERYRERLKLDQTGSLTITNTRTTDSGHYKVKISSNKQTLYKRFTVTVSEPGLSPAAVAGIVLLLLLMALTTAVGVLFYCRKKSELNNQKSKISERRNETSAISGKLKQMSKISTQLMQMTEDCEKELSEISEHHQTLKISEKLKEMSDISERLKQMSKDCEKELSEISERLKHMSLTKKGKNSEQETPLIDNRELFEQEMGTDVTKEDTRSEMEKGERERSIIVEDTTISQVIGGPRDADGRIRDGQGRSLVVRNTGTEHTGVFVLLEFFRFNILM
uniref:Immunoglobulin domain-containing protein n=1 Tax=Cyprinus carpio TaxID=7962 RepID=A0A8C2C490_CYPCA